LGDLGAVRGAAAGEAAGSSSGVNAGPGENLVFEMRRAVKTPAELRALLRAGFFGDLAAGLPTRNLHQLRDALRMMRRAGRGGAGGGDRQNSAADYADYNNSAAAAQGSLADEDRDYAEKSKYEEKLEDIIEQLSDVEPRFDFEVSVVSRPIVQNLFAGWAGRTWEHAAIRLAPEQVTPYAYSDPLSVRAVDLIPEAGLNNSC
jgi:hypothetical protein